MSDCDQEEMYRYKKYPSSTFTKYNNKPARRPYKKYKPDNGIPRTISKPRLFIPGRDREEGNYGRYIGKDAELKWFDFNVAASNPTTGGTIIGTGTIVNIAQNTGQSERIGRKITVKKVQLRTQIIMPALTANGVNVQGDILRVIVYQDKQCNGATAAVLDILTTNTWNSYRNLSNSNRFIVLSDKTYDSSYETFSVDAGGLFNAIGSRESDNQIMKCDIPIEYSGVTGAVNEIRSNNICVLAISAQGIVNVNLQFRTRYSDQ